jgi:hypothetical protein
LWPPLYRQQPAVFHRLRSIFMDPANYGSGGKYATVRHICPSTDCFESVR